MLKRVLAFGGQGRVVAIERPDARLDGQALLFKALAHIDAVGDAVAVGDDQGRAIIGFRFEEGAQRLLVVGAHGDAAT